MRLSLPSFTESLSFQTFRTFVLTLLEGDCLRSNLWGQCLIRRQDIWNGLK